MRISILAPVLAVFFVSGCSVMGVSTTEEAPYTVVERSAEFEIRQYPSLVLVRTMAEGNWDDAQRAAFRRLFAYISGNNSASQDISMTAPVLIDQESSRKIEMTAPVFQTGTPQGMAMSFVLPEKFTLATAPVPGDSRVKLVELPARKRLVHIFSGFLDPESMAEGKTALLNYAKENQIELVASTLTSAGYDPPWTIPWLRRNEVLVDVAAD